MTLRCYRKCSAELPGQLGWSAQSAGEAKSCVCFPGQEKDKGGCIPVCGYPVGVESSQEQTSLRLEQLKDGRHQMHFATQEMTLR